MVNIKHHWYKIFFVLVVFCLLFTVFYFWRSLKVSTVNTNISEANMTPEELIVIVGKLVVLPANEKPTIATVTDLTELQKQEFFRQAKVGDKVIIYAEAGKAILYSPTSNKIVEMAPLNKNLIGP